MNEKKTNSPVIVIVIIALLLLVVPCFLGLLFLGGWFMYQSAPRPLPERPAPVLVPEPSQPRPVDPLPNN